MVDITPLVPPGRQVIQSYGGGGFRVAGVSHRGSILIFPQRTLAWAVVDLAAATIETLAPVLEPSTCIEILLLGSGPAIGPIAPELRLALKEKGVVIEAMDTGAACRTFNILMAEDRPVAAALIALA